MKIKILSVLIIFIFCTFCTATDQDDKISVSTQRITTDQNKHQAFTDLVFFDQHFFLVFRESDKHVYGRNGIIKLMTSTNGKHWELLKEFNVSGIDLRDPKFSIRDNDLMLYIHGTTFSGKIASQYTDYRLKYSDNWSKIEKVTIDNNINTELKIAGNQAWPWRVTWMDGKAYTVGYNGLDIFRFYDSEDGLYFKGRGENLNLTGTPTEATIVANKGDLYFLTRRNNGTALFQKYNIKKDEVTGLGEIPFVNFGGPNFLFLNEKKIVFAGYLLGTYDLETHQVRIIYKFGGGETGYPGLIIKDDFLWVSFYASNESPNGSSIHLTKIKLKDLLR